VDTIQFNCKHLAFAGIDLVETLINGTALVELARAHEQPFADAEGHPDIAGGYDGMSPGDLWSGDSGLSNIDGSRTVQVLQCDGCYEPGCWPLMCRVEMSADRVVWSDFEQSHRDSGDDRWKYDTFGPFEFDRAQYDAAIAAATPKLSP
jgi:hypothetical protein